MLSTKPRVCVERAVLTTQAYQENMNQPLAIKRANMLAKVLDNMTIYIEPDSLLAGNQASSNRAAPISRNTPWIGLSTNWISLKSGMETYF